MSDDEMNIDDGMISCLKKMHTSNSLNVVVNGGTGAVRRRGRGFQNSAGATSLFFLVFLLMFLAQVETNLVELGN